MDFENSQTKKNLEIAFAGESQAHTKYRYYSSKAKKEGYVQISNIFMETALNESEHAKLWFKYLHEGEVPDTLTNLKDAAAGENYEWTTMYDGLPARALRCGSASTAATCMLVPWRPSSAPSAPIPRPTLRSRLLTTRDSRPHAL